MKKNKKQEVKIEGGEKEKTIKYDDYEICGGL